ncbi:NUDIX domain-containing protein [Seongchinamella sediminis]|uniref:NUDIX domain-containing protein n=1 Tax=Seongchinamella sediminis TaxID=2283635 RepID=A0A3L7E077_9GAMM|nr:NUDIX domain-containing protein [Seongchinamella sediminis]RLQ21522.1 NUDIX domain-containing protein [Seongchinamella sediminis]
MTEKKPIRPASTVVLLRDSDHGLETLLLRRNKALAFAGGFWVFPGGSLDAADLAAADGDEEQAARIAAAREAMEECGQQPDPDDMVLLSHWTTPEVERKRFATWIYAAPLRGEDAVVIDGGEIHDSRWLPVAQALAEHRAGELAMLPPTWISLVTLSHYRSVDEAIARERESPVPQVLPVLAGVDGDLVAMYRGDAGYDAADPQQPGPRHRACMQGGVWSYVYQEVDPAYPPLVPLPQE